jgi:hypothetical protein
MGRPLRRREDVTTVANGSSVTVNKAGVLGTDSLSGQQIRMNAYIPAADGGSSAAATSAILQKGTKRFRCTTAQGTGTCTLRAVASGSLAAGQCQLTATDSAGGTYYVSRVSNNWIEIGALGTGSQVAVGNRVQWVDDQTSAVAINTGTYAIGHPSQPGRFQVVTN